MAASIRIIIVQSTQPHSSLRTGEASQHDERIDVAAPEADGEVKRGPSVVHADRADDVALPYPVALRDTSFGEIRV
jgi:hypothetical protein